MMANHITYITAKEFASLWRKRESCVCLSLKRSASSIPMLTLPCAHALTDWSVPAISRWISTHFLAPLRPTPTPCAASLRAAEKKRHKNSEILTKSDWKLWWQIQKAMMTVNYWFISLLCTCEKTCAFIHSSHGKLRRRWQCSGEYLNAMCVKPSCPVDRSIGSG